MNVLVTYSSLTGNTKKVAESIFDSLENVEKMILPMSEVKSLEKYDVVIAGYWVDKGTANDESVAFLESLEGKQVGLFATLGYWADSDHAYESLRKGEDLVKEKNTVIARYICQGGVSKAIIEKFKSFPEGHPHAISEQKLRRYAIAEKHPSAADLAVAAELFNERLQSL